MGGYAAARMDERPWSLPLWWRLTARLVDLVALGWLASFVLVELDQRLLGGDPLGTQPGRLVVDDLRSLLLLVGAVALYEVVPVVRYGATMGKALLGLRVVDGRGERVGVSGAVSRAVVVYGAMAVSATALAFVWLALLVSVALHPWRRGLHDLAAGSRVVALDREGQTEAPG